MNVLQRGLTAVICSTLWLAMPQQSPPAAAGDFATLVKDINTTTKSSHARWFTAVDDAVFFVADDGVHGQELWSSDGSDSGTFLVKDFTPGSAETLIYGLTPGSDRLYFSADDGVHGRELWCSDGTASGTILVKDIVPGPANSNPQSLIAVGDLLYFVAVGAVGGLWRSDGTSQGTYPLDLGTPSGVTAHRLVAAFDRLFFTTTSPSGERDRAVWVTDGSVAGTTMLHTFATIQGPYGRPSLVAVNRNVFFVADDLVHGPEPWMSDGTVAGTHLVSDIVPGPNGSGVTALAALDNSFLFVARGATSDSALWRTDGTPAGTRLLAEIVPDADSWHAASGGLLYFLARDNRYRAELWRTDGTVSGTFIIQRIPRDGISHSPEWLADLHGSLVFTAQDRQYGRELWRSNGTEAGTVLVRDIRPGFDICTSYLHPCPSWLAVTSGAVLFAADDGEHGTEVWRSDGTEVGTELVKDVRAGTNGSFPVPRRELDGRLVFFAQDGREGGDWISDGTELGTVRLDAPASGARTETLLDGGRQDCSGTRLGDSYFFLGTGAVENIGLWRCDDTAAGRSLVRAVSPAGYELTAFAGKLFLRAWTEGDGAELWVSDGTTAGTQLFLAVRPGPLGGVQYPVEPQFTVVGATLYFVADDGMHGEVLWSSNGTSAGTMLVRDLRPGADGSAPQLVTAVDERLFFVADDGRRGRELWSSDGTEDGTFLVSDVNPGAGGSWPAELTRLGNRFLFAAHSDASGTELWESDGTATGTRLIRDIKLGPAGSFPMGLLAQE